MKKEENKIIGKRLKDFRNSKGYSQTKMFKLIKDFVNKNNDEDIIVTDETMGKQTISQIERGKRPLSLKMGLAYAAIFDVSLDHIYSRDENYKPYYKTITDTIGISNKAISKLENINTTDKEVIFILNCLIEKDRNNYFIKMLNSLNEYVKLKDKLLLENSPHVIHSVDDIEKYRLLEKYKKSGFTQFGPDDVLALSEYKINSFFNKMIYDVMKNGDK